MLLDGSKHLDGAGQRFDPHEPVPHRRHESIPCCGNDGPNWLASLDLGVMPAHRVEQVHQPTVDVDPQERAASGVPGRALANLGSGLEGDLHAVGHPAGKPIRTRPGSPARVAAMPSLTLSRVNVGPTMGPSWT